VFRDQTSLAANPDLWSEIEAALLSARYFLLMASPEAACSVWVDRETRLWRRSRRLERLLIVLTNGELLWDPSVGDFDRVRTTALPPSLFGAFTAEPLWVDMRWALGQDRLSLRHSRFRDTIATLAAPMHGRDKDELESEDVRQHRRLTRLRRGGVVGLAMLTAVAVVLATVALRQRSIAVQQSRVALSRGLAALTDVQAQDNPQVAAQLALAAYAAAPSPEAKAALVHEMDRNRHLLSYVRRGTDQVSTQEPASAPTPSHVALSPDGRLLAFAYGTDRVVTLWDTRQRREVGRLATDSPPGSGQFYSVAFGLAFAANGRLLAVDDSVRFQIWDVPHRRRVGTVLHRGEGGYRVALSARGRWVAQVIDGPGSEGILRIRDARTGAGLAVPPVPSKIGSDQVVFDGDRRLYVDYRGDGIRSLDLVSHRWTDPVPTGEADRPVPFALSADSAVLAVVTRGHLELWEPQQRRRLRAVPLAGAAAVSSVRISADARTLVIADDTGRVRAVDGVTGRATDLAVEHSGIVDLATDRDCTMVASIGNSGELLLATVSGDNLVAATAPPPGYGTDARGNDMDTVTSIAVGARGDLAVVGRTGGAEVRELPGLRLRSRLPTPSDSGDSTSTQVALSQDETRAAVLTPGRVAVMDTRSGKVLATTDLPQPGVSDDADILHFLPDGRHLLISTRDGLVVISDGGGTVQQLPGGGFAANQRGTVVAVIEKA